MIDPETVKLSQIFKISRRDNSNSIRYFTQTLCQYNCSSVVLNSLLKVQKWPFLNFVFTNNLIDLEDKVE